MAPLTTRLKKAIALVARQVVVPRQWRAVSYRWQAAVMVAVRYGFHLPGAVRLA